MAKVVIAELEIDITALLKSTSDLKKEIDALKNTQKDLAASGDKSSEAFVANEAVLKSLNSAYASNVKVIQESGKATKTQADQSELLSLALSQEATSIAEARQQNQLLNKLRNETNTTTAEGRNQLTALNAKLDQNNKYIKENADAYLQQKINVGNYKESIKEAFQEMNIFNGGIGGFIQRSQDAGGVGNLLSDSFGTIKNSIIGMTKAALTFIATPIGAALAGVVAIGAGAKEIFDFNKGLVEMNKELKALGVNSKEISSVRDELKATADTFDKDFKDIASKANSLSQSYGISMSEANKIIAEGLANGGAQNQEFLDSLGEYDVFFANAGFSAQEFTNIINSGFELGIYADKLPDALKEADLALKENTKSTRDALVNAFGASFSDEILTKVKTGELTTKQAIDEIAKASQNANLSQQQYAQLTADVFKGAGEDVGGSQKIFEALGKAATKELNATESASLKLVQANERLNKAQSALFEIEGFGDIWTNIKALSVDALSAMLEYISDVKKDIQPLLDIIGVVFVAVWENLKFSFTSAFNVISGVVKSFASYFNGIVNFWKKLLVGDFKGAFIALSDGITNSFKNIGNIFVNLYNGAIKLVKGLVDATAPLLKTLGVDVDSLQKKLDSLKGKTFEVKGQTTSNISSAATNTTTNTTKQFGSGGGGATADDAKAQQKIEEQKAAAKAKAIEDEKKKLEELAKAKIDLAKAELDLFLATEKSKLDGAKFLTDELLAEEERRLKLIEQKKLEQLAKEKKVDVAKIEEKKLNNEALTQAETEYETQRIILASETDKTIQANKKTLEEQIKVQKAEQLVIDNELELAAAQTKAEEDAIKAEQDYQTEMARFTKLLTDKKITQEQFDAFKKNADDKKAELDNLRQIQQVQSALGGLNNIAGAVGSLFGQSKELALVQAGINGAMAITSILAQYPKFDGGFAMTAAIIAAGATTVAQVAKIASAKTPATPKFEKGGIQEIGGKRHSAGGTKFWGEDGTRFEAEAGEGIGILNRNAFASFMDFNNSHSSGRSNGGFFAGGGIITQGVRPETLNIESVVDAIASMPAPVVAVEEIQTVGNRYATVVNGANL
jgi:hypothetical protein